MFLESYTDLENIARNLKNDVPKINLQRIDLSSSLSSIESGNEDKNSSLFSYIIFISFRNIKYITIFLGIDVNLSRNKVLDESIEKNNQQGMFWFIFHKLISS